MQQFSQRLGALPARRVLSGVRTSGALLGVALTLPALALDLRQTYEAAVQNDSTIRAARAAAEATRERLPQAHAQLLPQASLNIGRNFNDLTSKTQNIYGPVTQQNSYYSGNQNLTVRQPLYRPGAWVGVDQAKAQVSEADANLEREEQGLVVRVAEAYFDALLARTQLDLVAAQKRNLQAHLDAAQKSLRAGSGTRTDVDEAKAQLDMVFAQELEAAQNLEFTQRRVAVLTGSEDSTDLVDLDVQRFKPVVPAPADISHWVSLAESASPELQALRAQQEAASHEISKAQAGHKPTLDAVAQWSRSNSDSVSNLNSRYDQRAIGVQFSMPLYSGGQVSSAVRQALANHERVSEALEAARRDLGVRVHREFRGVTEGVARIAALEQAVRSAEQAVQSNRRSFEAGSRTTLDVLNTEQKLVTAMRDLAQARYMYMVSSMRLQSLAGHDRWSNIDATNSNLTVGALKP